MGTRDDTQCGIIISALEIGAGKDNLESFEDPKEYLNPRDEKTVQEGAECPILSITIENQTVMALIDTGSPYTCIADAWQEENNARLKSCEKLPVVNFQVVGATGGKPTKIKLQLFLKVQIGNLKDQVTFLVIPKLHHQAIIGMDTLTRWRSIIDNRSAHVKY